MILRLLARSPVRDLALVEARATLPDFSKHRIGQVLARWHLIAVESKNPSEYEQEIIMDPEAIRLADESMENQRRAAREEAEREAHHSTLLTIYEARFQTVPDEVKQALVQTTNVATLKCWIPIFTTGSPEQIREAVLG